MRVTSEVVAATHEWVHERGDVVVPLLNLVRARLGPKFNTTVDTVSPDAYHDAVDEVFADGDRAVNVTALVCILRDLDVEADYPGFIVDELLGRELAAMIAGQQPRRLLAESTFHYADVLLSELENTDQRGVDAASGDVIARDVDAASGDAITLGVDAVAGADDLDAALAAGFQTRLPGWDWTERDSPFSVQ